MCSSAIVSIIEQSAINLAVEALARGELVAFPTETVYGLGTDAMNVSALRHLFEVKGRPRTHPVIVHIANVDQLEHWACHVPPSALKLAEAFWPGPLTLILPKAKHVLDEVTGGQSTVGIRIPRHPVAQALLKEFGGGVAAPSANRFGRLSATCAEDVCSEFGYTIACILNGGPCQVGIESTIVDLSSDTPQILRPGMILSDEISSVLGEPLISPEHAVSNTSKLVVRAPGTLPRHYAPKTPLCLVRSESLYGKIEACKASGLTVAVMSFTSSPSSFSDIAWMVASGNPVDFAHNLYRNLRFLDRQSCDYLLVESVPDEKAWKAIADRLRRASAHGL